MYELTFEAEALMWWSVEVKRRLEDELIEA